MKTALFTHTACLDHDTSPGHPESTDRLRAVLSALEEEAFMFLDRREAPLAEREQIARVHPRSYVDAVLDAVPANGYAAIDGDTILSPGSGEAALRAAGALCGAVGAVVAGEVTNAFCAVRPPGHHAEPSQAMGFCLFNNVAVGALEARERHGLRRVAVVDFDVHHGNGTQTMFQDDPELMFVSTHQSPLYPGTGHAHETGCGNILNVTLPPHSGSPEIRHAYQMTILPALRAFAPDLILISAGFDAHHRDPLAQLNFTEDDYAWMTRKLLDLAREECDGRLVSTLEGGYDLQALASSCARHVRELMEG